MYTGNEVETGGKKEINHLSIIEKLYSLNIAMGRLKKGPCSNKIVEHRPQFNGKTTRRKTTPWMSTYNKPKKHQKQVPCYITEPTKKPIKSLKTIHIYLPCILETLLELDQDTVPQSKTK